MKYDVIIIGSGLGGLECGYILSKCGYNVCILEKNNKIGGCLQSFKRGEYEFDSGFHYVGGLADRQPLNRLFTYFNLMHLPWHKLDEDAFDEIILNDHSYYFANGFERFAQGLSYDFPLQHDNLLKYANFLKNVGDNIFDAFQQKDIEEISTTSLFAKSAYQFLTGTISDKTLQNVLSGSSLKMELDAEKLPLYIFAQINSSYIQSAWRLKGCGSMIAASLANDIKNMGGTIMTNAEVDKLIENNDKVAYAQLNNGTQIEAKYFISDIHPTATFSLIPESHAIRKIFRKRIATLPNTYGMFTVNIALKKNTIPYINRNIYIYDTDDLWHISAKHDTSKINGALISFQVPHDGSIYTDNIDILTPMYWDEVSQWSNTEIGRRRDDYLSMKNAKAEMCIDFVSRALPLSKLKNSIAKILTSTPLSYQNYTATIEGSAYGIRKDYQSLLYTLLTPRTQLPNLFLTGQNLNLHGVLGVTMTSFFTCAELPHMRSVINNIVNKI